MIKKIKKHVGSYLPALKSFNYRLYFVGQGISLIGSWLQGTAEQWLVYPTLTRNKSILGIITGINMVVTALFLLVAGVIADRVNKRKTTIILQFIFGIIAFIMYVLIATGEIRLWHVILVTAINGLIFAFDIPVRNSLTLDFVEKKYYPSALSLNSSMFNIARALGPALAGFFIASVGIPATYLFNAVSFLAVILSLSIMKLPKHIPQENRPTIKKDFKEGLLYIKKNKAQTVLLGLVGLISLFNMPRMNLLPVFAHDIFNKGAIGFGILQSMMGIGAVTGALIFASFFEKLAEKFKLLYSCAILMIVTNAIFSFSPSFIIAIITQFLSGIALSCFNVTAQTIIQLKAPSHLQGRMMSFFSFVLFLFMPIGALLASIGVGYFGAQYTVFISSVLLAIGSIILIIPYKIILEKETTFLVV